VRLRGPLRSGESMKPYSNLGRSASASGSTLSVENDAETRTSAAMPAKKASGNGASRPKSSLRVPEDAGRSQAKMAEGELDAALQLLADRAQYITGAGGAAIALRREGRADMLCRASSGSNAPELGALLSAEFGLSGESVRTRRPLRCDDAERDPRVNREGCRQMGIASVVVMPIIHNDEVGGVFELFSGKANAFKDRDLAALKRLSEMVETAVRLASSIDEQPQVGPEKCASKKPPTPAVLNSSSREIETASPSQEGDAAQKRPSATVPAPAAPERPKPALPKKPLFWFAALAATPEKIQAPESDQSHVPPVLRNLRKCEACSFPISEGRVLCVECEEKKWRGKLTPKTPAAAAPALASVTAAIVPALVVLEEKPSSPDIRRESAVTTVARPILSAGLPASGSWLASNKYIIGTIVLIATGVASFLLLR
jgi:hypothetical protein